MNILITGGASGLGGAITRLLASNQGDTVCFTYSSSLASAQSIEKQFVNTTAIKCDFKSQTEVDFLKEKIDTLDLDVLINNSYSGEAIKSHFHRISPDEFLNDFSVNLIPTIELTQVAIKNFRKKKKGKIITILTSYLLNNPPIGSSVYVANKAYLQSLVKSWATENVKYNITSNSISPSMMLSNLTKDVDERLIEQMVDNHPLKKLLTFEEVAEAVLFLVNASSQMNGNDIVINAGANIK